MRCLRLSPLALCLAAPLPTLAAQPHADAVTLDRVEVIGQRGILEASASGGTRLDLSIRDTPASVFRVDRDTLDARGVRNTQEALFSLPGLVVASPPGNGNAVTWRGFSGAQVTQLFNGINVQYASIAARPVDAWMYERVEAVGGPSSFLSGAGAVGGTIDYVTRRARFDADDFGGVASLGSFDSHVLAGGFNHRVGGDDAVHALRGDAGYSARDGWADNERREAWTGAASWAWKLTPALVHTLALEAQAEDNARVYWGSPAVLGADRRLRILPGTSGRNYNVGDGVYAQDVTWARSLLEWERGSAGHVRNTLYRYDARRDYRNVESYRYTAARDGVERSGVLQQRHDQQVTGNRTDWTLDGALFGRPTQWATGLELAWNKQTRYPQSIGGTIDTVPVDSRTPGYFFDIPGTSPAYLPGATNRLRTQALSLENITRLTPRLGLLIGLRHERIDLEVTHHRTVTPTSPAHWQRDFTASTGRVGLNLDVGAANALYVQASTAADPPAGILSTAGSSTLRDFDLSKGHQIEAGFKRAFDDGRGAATLAAYRIVRTHLAIADPANPGQTLPVGQQASRGLEATLDWRPIDALRLQANGGWVDAQLDDFTETVGGVVVSRAGNRPANTPARVGNLWLDYAFAPDWGIGVDLRAVDARQANAANTVQTAGYALWGAHLRWQATPALSLELRGRNLGDRTYVMHAIGTDMVYLGEPRSIELALRLRR